HRVGFANSNSQFSCFSHESNSELAQMMITVQITPAHPIAFTHLGKQRMTAPFEIALGARDSTNDRLEFVDVTLEFHRWSPTSLLIIFGHRRHTVRPLERRVQCNPPHDGLCQQTALVAVNLSFADDTLERI